jgi:hypothetical protein
LTLETFSDEIIYTLLSKKSNQCPRRAQQSLGIFAQNSPKGLFIARSDNKYQKKGQFCCELDFLLYFCFDKTVVRFLL